MAKFTEHVALHDDAQTLHRFAPGDEVPDWADVGEHVTDGPTTPAKRSPGRPRKEAPKAEQED